MFMDRKILAFAGVMVLASLALARWLHPAWLLLTAFVGLNLLIAGTTGFCAAASILKKIAARRTA